jgi:uncharacterized protein (TIGR02722 family)
MSLALLRAPRAGRVLALAALALSAACNSTRVSRVDPNSVTDLSGRWNDADSRLVANALIQQSLDAPWARNYATANGGKQPTVIIGAFRNRSMEHIPVGTFTRDLERAFVNSGTVQIVASKEERGDIRDERADQQQNATAETRARMAREQGARYMLQGDVQTIEDSEGKEKIVYYQIDATLIDLESNAKVWLGQHKIKKFIERRGIGL